jgi:thiol:disulfide interchange protein
MMLRSAFAFPVLALAFLSACKGHEDVPEGIRPEITALPPEMRPQAAAAAAHGGETWNAAQIDWQPYDAGLQRARAQNKPICLVFFTNWCPHCKNFSRVFEDPRVVERAKDFVMIRANADEESAIASKYTKDGGYVPRTFFLAPDGTMDPDLHAPRPKFLYFYDERDPSSLLGGMEAALRKFAK